MLDSRYFIKLSNNVVYKKMDQDIILLLVQTLLNLENVFFFSSDPKSYISMVPTSAHTGEGMGNLMALLVKLSQDMLAKRLAFSQEMQATVLEVKAIPGLGTTIDIVLLNGSLREGQTMIVAGTDGPIVTVIKALLTPSKMQDLRVKVKLVTWHWKSVSIGLDIWSRDIWANYINEPIWLEIHRIFGTYAKITILSCHIFRQCINYKQYLSIY